MGNIFKTLGLDDLFGNMFGEGSGFLGTLLTGATGGLKGRPQWKDLQFMNDAQNRLWPDEIKRQGDFLQGMAEPQGQALETLAPHQANAYNIQQDATYGEDVRRQTEGIKSMAEGLNMSPWEITGSGGVSQLPSTANLQPQSGQGSSQVGQFLQGIIPLKIAKLNAMTALQQTKMQTDASIQNTKMQTNSGETAKADIALKAAQVLSTEANTSKTFQDIEAQAQDMVVQVVTTVLNNMPTEELAIGGYTRRQKQGAGGILRKLAETGQGTWDAMKVRQELSKYGQDEMKQLADDLRYWGKYMQGADMLGIIGKGVRGFLSGTQQVDSFNR